MSSFLGDEYAVPLERAGAAILPVPWEATVSYGAGTARGPRALIEASAQIEVHDEWSGGEPWRGGVHTLPALDLSGRSPAQMIEEVGRGVGELMDAGLWVAAIGGEHSITPAAVAAAALRREGLHLVQLDAHADLRESYEGQRHSHACAMARCLDHVSGLNAIGIRSYSPEEAERIESGIPGYRMTPAWELDRQGWIDAALEGVDGKPVYLTIDVDYFDPSIMPATGTPEPGGGRWWPTLRLLEELFRRADVVGCDVVELAPIEGLHHPDFTAARLVYKLLGLALSR